MMQDELLDEFYGRPERQPQEIQFDKFVTFLKEYCTELGDMEKTLAESKASNVWDMATDVISLDMEPRSRETLEEILGVVNRDNKIVFKLILCLTALAAELKDLCAEARETFIPPLVVFGEQPELNEGDMQIAFGRILPLLMDLWNFCDRTYTVIQNLTRQFASLYSSKSQQKNSVLSSCVNIHFTPIWLSLSEALGTLIYIDEVIRQTESFNSCATYYKRMMRNVAQAPEKFEADEIVVKRFGFLMGKLEGDLMGDIVYQNCVYRDFESVVLGISVRENPVFRAEFFQAIKFCLDKLMLTLGRPSEMDTRYSILGLCGLVGMYYTVFRDICAKDERSRKLFKDFWTFIRQYPVVHLSGVISFCPGEWLARHTQEMVNIVAAQNYHADIVKSKGDASERAAQSFKANCNNLAKQVATWCAKMDTRQTDTRVVDVVQKYREVLTEGLALAWQASNTVRTTLSLFVMTDRKWNQDVVMNAIKLVELMKTIQMTFHRRSLMIGNLLSLIVDFQHHEISKKLGELAYRLKQRQMNKPMADRAEIDQLSALEIMAHVMRGTPSRARFLVFKTAMCFASQSTQSQLIKPADFDFIERMINITEWLAEHQWHLGQACNTSVMYWFKEMWGIYFKSVFKNPDLISSLVPAILAIHDPVPLLYKSQHVAEKDALVNIYTASVEEAFKEKVITPLCKEIEDDLRLHIHSVVLGDHSRDVNSILKSKPLSAGALRDLSRFTMHDPIHLFGKLVSFRGEVENYLNDTFYKLTVLHPNDWKTYEELRSLCKEKYDVDLLEVHLPGATIEQGLDILQITRNIHLFVQRYTYNMNNQLFVEKPSTTKSNHLHTISIRHIANSIRTHGTGIMNTTVNFVYMFLGKKFYVFSQFLFDDHIRSRLMNDHRKFLEHRDALSGNFPYTRAEQFTKDIRKLGETEGKSYLDQFRELVTEIGNALGYVRTVRSGGLRYISDSVKFIPDITDVIKFEPLVEESELSEMTIAAAKNLDTHLGDLSNKFSEGSEYFTMIENAFAEELHKEKNAHLKHFFVIIPALTVSYVEYIRTQKEQVGKKNKDAVFTDDGFAMGVAFILKLLNQQKHFNSLHWFRSVQMHYDALADAEKAKASKSQKAKDSEDIATSRLTLNLIDSKLTEFEFLKWTMNSAFLLFMDRVKKEKSEEEEGEGEGEEEETEE